MQDSRAFGLGVAVADLCAYRYIRDTYRERERERKKEKRSGALLRFLLFFLCSTCVHLSDVVGGWYE